MSDLTVDDIQRIVDHLQRANPEYPDRVRQDYRHDQLTCVDKQLEGRTYGPGKPEPTGACYLPNDCERCERYICNRCEKTTPWSNGSDGDGGALCDECWGFIIAPWQDEEDALEEQR